MLRSRKFESLWPYVGTVIALFCWYKFGAPFPPSPDGLFGASATLASIFASFLGVSKAVILSIKASETYKILEKAGYTDLLYDYLKSGIFSSVMFAALSIIGFFVSPHKDAEFYGLNLFSMFAGIWVLFGFLALATYIRITNILFKLLKNS